jgi:hypothetical protein
MFISGEAIGGPLVQAWGLDGVRNIVIRVPTGQAATVELECLVEAAHGDDVVTVFRDYALVPRQAWTSVDDVRPKGHPGMPIWVWDGESVALLCWRGGEWERISLNELLRPILAWQPCLIPQPPET